MSQRTASRSKLWLGLIFTLALCAGLTAAAAETVEPSAEIAFGTGVDRAARALTGEGTEFSVAEFSAEFGQVFCLTSLANMPAPTTVTHVWYYQGKTMARVDLNVGGSHWRTWSSKRILPRWTGAWEVKVLDADGMVLATSGFTVK